MNNDEMTTRFLDNVKMAGFLEKKGKMKLVSPWKKYWFVLEERLLLYYKSQIEYINLSPCRGSLNMGLVSTVRPGSSSGPCVIHVITRTQVVQLRAKDRAVQEEWLQALLDSMSIPVISKTLTAPLTTGLHCLRYSMDNLPTLDQVKQEVQNRQRTLPHKLNHRKNPMGGGMFGGSLDTAIWSKKVRPVRSPSPNIPKGKMLERILGYVEEVEIVSTSDTSLAGEGSNGSLVSINKSDKEKGSTENIALDGEIQKEESKKETHDENQNHDYYSTVDKFKKKEKVPVTNNCTVKVTAEEAVEELKTKEKENSRFERIKNVITRKPKDKVDKTKSEPPLNKTVNTNLTKKRRQSFLQKVFKRHHKKREVEEQEEEESDLEDPLYDTIDNVKDQKENVASKEIKTESQSNEEIAINETQDLLQEEDSNKAAETPLYSEIQKPVFGSKSILTVQAMSELKNKLKSRESLERQEIEILPLKQDEIESELSEVYSKVKGKEQKSEKSAAPALPPRRGSRPKSPWHDIPVNNTPVDEARPTFNTHQSMVRFYDELPVLIHECNVEECKDESNIQSESQGSKYSVEKKSEKDLSTLLEQLAEITTAPLLGVGTETEKHSNSLDSEQFWIKPRMERRFSDPDYDVPRPHKPINLSTSNEIDRIIATEFLGKSDDTSDSSSHPSMEPDSLETADNSKKT